MEETKYYLTKEGLKEIDKEYKKLVDFRNMKVKGELPNIGYSEEINTEYLIFQEDIGFIEAKIAEYEEVLKNAEIIRLPKKEERHMIHLGARITVEVDGQKDEFMIVGSLEANPTAGRISNESPVGKSLLGRKMGEVVEVHSSVKVVYKILNISY